MPAPRRTISLFGGQAPCGGVVAAGPLEPKKSLQMTGGISCLNALSKLQTLCLYSAELTDAITQRQTPNLASDEKGARAMKNRSIVWDFYLDRVTKNVLLFQEMPSLVAAQLVDASLTSLESLPLLSLFMKEMEREIVTESLPTGRIGNMRALKTLSRAARLVSLILLARMHGQLARSPAGHWRLASWLASY